MLYSTIRTVDLGGDMKRKPRPVTLTKARRVVRKLAGTIGKTLRDIIELEDAAHIYLTIPTRVSKNRLLKVSVTFSSGRLKRTVNGKWQRKLR